MKKTKRWVLFPLLLAVLVVIGGIVLLAAWTAPIDTSFSFDDSLNNGKELLVEWGVEPELAKHISSGGILDGMLKSNHFYCRQKWFDADGRAFLRESHVLIENGQAKNAGEEKDGEETVKNAAVTEDTLLVFVQSETGIVTVARLLTQKEMPAIRLTDQIRLVASNLNFVTGSGFGLLVTEGNGKRGYRYLDSSVAISDSAAALQIDIPLPFSKKVEQCMSLPPPNSRAATSCSGRQEPRFPPATVTTRCFRKHGQTTACFSPLTRQIRSEDIRQATLICRIEKQKEKGTAPQQEEIPSL